MAATAKDDQEACASQLTGIMHPSKATCAIHAVIDAIADIPGTHAISAVNSANGVTINVTTGMATAFASGDEIETC
jgi:hypothetical protein